MPEINQRLSLADIHTIPLGSRVNLDGYQMTLEADGFHEDQYGRRVGVYAPHQARSGTLIEMGDRLLVETVQQYGQRLRTLTLGQAWGAGITRDPIYRIFEKEGIAALTVPILGMWVHMQDRDLYSIIPEGAVAVSGDHTSPRYGVWVWRNSQWNPMLGGRRNSPNAAFQILWVPEGTALGEWEAARQDEAERVTELKARLFTVGLEAKASNSWCGEYEAAMGRAGIDDHIGMALRMVTHGQGGVWLEQAARHTDLNVVPPGSLLLESQETTVSNRAFFVRCGTDASLGLLHASLGSELGVFRPTAGGDYSLDRASWVHFVALPDFEQGTPVESVEHMQQALVGSEVSNRGFRWVKVEPDQWACIGQVEVTDPRTDMSRVSMEGRSRVDSHGFSPDGRTLLWITTRPPFDGTVEGVVTRRQMVVAPVGSVMRDGSTRWVKCEDGRWGREGYASDRRHHPTAFSMGSLRWVEIPTGLAANPEADEVEGYGWATGQRDEFTVSFEWPEGRPPLHSTATREQIETAPIGAAVVLARSGAIWRREEHGWRGNNSNQLHSVDSFARHIGDLSWHAVNPAAIREGRATAQASRAKIPVGSVVERDGVEWAKVDSTTWVNRAGDRCSHEAMGAAVLRAFGMLPAGTARAETQVVWR